MEKLIELLNEYGDINWNKAMIEHQDTYIISKKFGFIKWLVENDKIDLDKVEKKFYNEICTTDYGDKDRAYGKSNLVISVLSISNNPIQNLVSFLKNV